MIESMFRIAFRISGSTVQELTNTEWGMPIPVAGSIVVLLINGKQEYYRVQEGAFYFHQTKGICIPITPL